MKTYLHLPSGELRPRHTDYGAQVFSVPNNEWVVGQSQAALEKALDAARESGGGTLRIIEDVYISSPVLWASNLRTIANGATIRATMNFSGNYLLNVLDARNFEFIELCLRGMKTANGMSVRRSHNATWLDCDITECKTGIYIEQASSNITVVGGSSHGNTMHGIAIDDKKCTSVAVLSMHLHHNGAYGFDTHGTAGELAGCIIEGNGRSGDDYEGACVKLPEAVNWWLHDNDLRNSGSGPRGAIWSYTIERPPQSQMFYRNEMRAHIHFDSGRGGDISHCDNYYFTADGTPSGMGVKGPGRIAEDPNLREMPSEVDDGEGAPVEAEYVTAAQARAIAEQVFGERLAAAAEQAARCLSGDDE